MSGPSPSVLIVEDDRDTREMLEHFLQLEGFEVRSAPNGDAALHSLQSGARPCVILLDLMMPVMNGWQFREAQTRNPDFSTIPVIVVTAAGPRGEVPRIDADGWVSKPVDLEQLLGAIEAVCPR